MSNPDPAPVATAPEEWIVGAEGARRMGISNQSFAKVVRTGAVRRRQYPGLQPSYAASDVQRLIDEAVITGTVSQGAAG